ncbi:MAG: hypothetical protein COB12_03990 [Flavobacterium sp.]|nr:MAG: hypothetical protein COB12_03990 [Flavobacterium sp.]
MFSQTTIDSLKQVINTTKNDSIKIDTYLRLFVAYSRTDANISLKYVIKAQELAQKNGFELSFANTKYREGSILRDLGEHSKSNTTLNEALTIYNKLEYLEGIINVKIEQAILLQDQFKLEEATMIYIDALPFTIKSGDINTEARIHNNLGGLYKTLKQKDKAIYHYKKALTLVKEINFKPGISAILTNLGSVDFELNDYKRAENYLKEALTLKIEAGDKLGESRVLSNLALIQIDKKEYTLAETNFRYANDLAIEVNNKQQLSVTGYGLAECAFLKKEYKKCIQLCNTLLPTLKEINQLEVSNAIYEFLSKSYHSLGDYKNAFNFSELHNKLSDSLYNKNILEISNTLDAKYQNNKNAKEIELLKSQNQLIEQQKTNQRNLLLGGLAFTSLVGLFFFLQYKNRKKINNKLKELSVAKSNFFANISHEFRTPLTLISGPIQAQLKKENLTEEERSNLEMMQRNSNRLLSLVNQLLDISKIESGRIQLKISNQQIIPFIGILVDGFTFIIKQKNIKFVSQINPTMTETWFDKDAVEKIVINLLSNAIKYTNENGTIECYALVENDHLHFEVKNTGKGLTKNEITHIFERFYQVNEDKLGVGIGLSLVKELINLHKGTVSVESTINQWTSFKVILPINKSAFNNDEYAKQKSFSLEKETIPYLESKSEINTEELQTTEDDKLIILIVDDNADIRSYVSTIFNKKYAIIEAENGQKGIDLAIKHIPDIIISDVMMPVLDGIALSINLKKDERTSHIPIILLTAKSGDQNEIAGIKTGADDYITKPFSEDLLKLKVENRIENLKKLQERFSQEIVLRPKDISVNSIEEQFLEKIQIVLDTQLTETSFSIQDFCEATAMSRMQLHRKLKALTGLSTTEFIKSQRLKLATTLLKNSDINISQIGYAVGFNDHAYFSKSFKEMYFCTPSEYANKSN